MRTSNLLHNNMENVTFFRNPT